MSIHHIIVRALGAYIIYSSVFQRRPLGTADFLRNNVMFLIFHLGHIRIGVAKLMLTNLDWDLGRSWVGFVLK